MICDICDKYELWVLSDLEIEFIVLFILFESSERWEFIFFDKIWLKVYATNINRVKLVKLFSKISEGNGGGGL